MRSNGAVFACLVQAAASSVPGTGVNAAAISAARRSVQEDYLAECNAARMRRDKWLAILDTFSRPPDDPKAPAAMTPPTCSICLSTRTVPECYYLATPEERRLVYTGGTRPCPGCGGTGESVAGRLRSQNAKTAANP